MVPFLWCQSQSCIGPLPLQLPFLSKDHSLARVLVLCLIEHSIFLEVHHFLQFDEEEKLWNFLFYQAHLSLLFWSAHFWICNLLLHVSLQENKMIKIDSLFASQYVAKKTWVLLFFHGEKNYMHTYYSIFIEKNHTSFVIFISLVINMVLDFIHCFTIVI